MEAADPNSVDGTTDEGEGGILFFFFNEARTAHRSPVDSPCETGGKRAGHNL